MTNTIEVKIPDIGGSTVDVIEILVKEGDVISKDASLVTLESDKASMEIPSPIQGTVSKINLNIGDKVSEGDVILLATIESTAEKKGSLTENNSDEHSLNNSSTTSVQSSMEAKTTADGSSNTSQEKAVVLEHNEIESSRELDANNTKTIAAGPAVRRMARELGVDLTQVVGSSRKNRISKEDIQSYVKSKLNGNSTGDSFAIPSNPIIDFSQFGDVDSKPLNKIKRLTGLNVHHSWISIPHVTQFDHADITDIEAFRKKETEHGTDKEYKLTLLAFVSAVVCKALKKFPQFNASLNPTGTELIFKKYFNIGIAVETPNGLVVPVMKHVDQMSVVEIAKEMSRLSTKAREKGLMPADMSGGCFTISSLGGIGGTSFTPIVNSPEVAILGLSRAEMKPVFTNGAFIPRLYLPLSLSYDHRVIDGAEAARFTRYISECLSDIRRILL